MKVYGLAFSECVQPSSISILNQGLQQNIYIDYQKRDKLFEITRVAALKELMDQVWCFQFGCRMRFLTISSFRVSIAFCV